MKTIKRKELNEIQLTLLTASAGTLRTLDRKRWIQHKEKAFPAMQTKAGMLL